MTLLFSIMMRPQVTSRRSLHIACWTCAGFIFVLGCQEGPRTISASAQTDARNQSILNASGDSSVKEDHGPGTLFTIPDFELIDQTGAPFSSKSLHGRVWIANFIFTRCGFTCPRQTQRVEQIVAHVRRWPDGDRLRYVSFTVDPEFDTPEVLTKYADEHRADAETWKFLTGSREKLLTLSRNGFHFPVSGSANEPNALITHSPRFVLVDRQMKARGIYDSLTDDGMQQLYVDLRSILSESISGSDEVANIGAPPEIFDTPCLQQRSDQQRATASDISAFHDFSFSDELPRTGITFVNRVVADAAKNVRLNHDDHGTGLAVADVDRDGHIDLYFVNQMID